MLDGDDNPSMSLMILRLGTLFAVVALVGYLFWEMFSESAALSRLSATANIYPYTERCDANGQSTAIGQPNCVDLNHYLFVHGSVDKAFRRACSGKPATVLSFEKGKVGIFEINIVEKMLQFRRLNGVNSPC